MQQKETANVKVIKAPKFANKMYEMSKSNNKSGRNESNIDNKHWFVLQPSQNNGKHRVRLSNKRNSMVSNIPSFQAPRPHGNKIEEKKRWESGKKKDRPSISRGNLKISIKTKDGKDNSRINHSGKLSIDIHQRSNQEPINDYENLLSGNAPNKNPISERHTSSLIENFDHSDFIKNVIMQSRKVGGTRFGSPGQNVNLSYKETANAHRKGDKNFMKDMKKHGILKAFNDINKFTEFFQSSPTSGQEDLWDNSLSYKHWSSQVFENEYQSTSMRDIIDSAPDKNTKSTYLLEELQKEEEKTKNLKSFKWIFPFQRRARSHSPPKNSVISNKIIETMNNNSPDGALNDKDAKIKQKQRQNKPVIASANFIIGSYHLLNKREKLESVINEQYHGEGEHNEKILQGKEVEEWLMGSGLSIPDATTGCTDNSEQTKQFSESLNGFLKTFKNKHTEKEKEEEIEEPKSPP